VVEFYYAVREDINSVPKILSAGTSPVFTHYSSDIKVQQRATSLKLYQISSN
jgi:hypothetical protein